MKKLLYFFLVTVILLTGCKGCLNKLYSVHEPNNLDIEFGNNKISSNALLIYLDSNINNDTAEYEISSLLMDTTAAIDTTTINRGLKNLKDSAQKHQIETTGQILDSIEHIRRIIHFKRSPNEYYLIYINSNSYWISGIKNKNIAVDWIFDKDKIKDEEVDRIKKRFETEILYKISIKR